MPHIHLPVTNNVLFLLCFGPRPTSVDMLSFTQQTRIIKITVIFISVADNKAQKHQLKALDLSS